MGINPGKQTVYYMCKTWLQKVHSGWDMGAGGQNLEIKIYKTNLFSLFYFMSKMLKIQYMECNTVNCMHVEDVKDYKNTCIVVSCANVEDVKDI